jgi:hypothetical protein
MPLALPRVDPAQTPLGLGGAVRLARLELVRLVRGLVLFKLGALVGMAAAAAIVKRAVPSRGDETSDELALVAILEGVELKSRARVFKGGSMLAWFGGIDVDLRDVELDAGAQLSTYAIFGGIEIKTPPHWRIESSANAILGGVDTPAPDDLDPDAPVLAVAGTALLGGIEIDS